MYRRKTTVGLFLLAGAVLLTGCADRDRAGKETGSGKETEIREDLVPLAAVGETFDAEADKLKGREFDNLNFADAYFSFTEADEVYSFAYEDEVADLAYSPDEAYDYLCGWVDELFPGMYNEEQKAHEIRFIDAEPGEGYEDFLKKREKDPHSVENEITTYFYPTLEQYKKGDHVTDCPNPEINNNDCYIELLDGALWGYDKGELAKRSGYDGALWRFDTLETFPVVYRTEDLGSQKTYHLESGDISIADAVRSADECLAGLELSFRELPFRPSVQSVNVLDIGDGCFAFLFGIVTEFEGMKFQSLALDNSYYSVTVISDQTNSTNIQGRALMYEAGQLDRYGMVSPFFYSDITQTDSYSSVMPLEKAAEAASDYLTDGMHFNVLGVSAGYKQFAEKDIAQYKKGEVKKMTIRPCWRFLLKPTADPTDRLYYVFVDMVTGETYTVVQQMESDVEYGVEYD